MNHRSRCLSVLVAFLLTTAMACGDDDKPEPPERFPALSEAEPLQYRADRLGVGVQHGATVQLKPTGSGSGVLQRTQGVVDHAFLHVNIYDVFASTFGEYIYYAADSSAEVRGATYFRSNAGAARFAPRASDLYAEVEAAMARSQGEFSSYSVVLDFWDTTATWYVPWDGKTNRNPDSYGFYRDDLREDVLAQIKTVAETHKPRYFIVGSDMERLLVSDAGTFSEAEFSNFLLFFQDAVRTIHAVSPDTQVGAGINWGRFAERVAPHYLAEESAEGADVQTTTHAQLDAGFAAAILPLVQAGDILALKSYADPAEVEPSHYQFLRRRADLYQSDKPLVWYSIGSPVTSKSSYNTQRLYLERFAEWNAGLEPEMIAWRALMNIDGTDTSSGVISGACQGLTGQANDFKVPLERCYDGLFSSALQPKPAFQLLKDAVQ